MADLVMARTAGGSPIRRLAVASGRRVVYLCREDARRDRDRNVANVVGFPKSDVFQWDEQLYAKLSTACKQDMPTVDDLWRLCRPYQGTG